MQQRQLPNLAENEQVSQKFLSKSLSRLTSIADDHLQECCPGPQSVPSCRFASLGSEPNMNRGWSRLRSSSKLISPRRCAPMAITLIAMSAMNLLGETIVKM